MPCTPSCTEFDLLISESALAVRLSRRGTEVTRLEVTDTEVDDLYVVGRGMADIVLGSGGSDPLVTPKSLSAELLKADR